MSWYEILIIVFACAFVAGVIVWQIIRKKKGKSGCDCGDCGSCGGCPACKPKSGDDVHGRDGKKQ